MPTTSFYRPLWNDFLTRSHRLASGGPAKDSVDLTIRWQLDGTKPFCEQPLSHANLQLPELYSGAPWRPVAQRPQSIGDRWIAFVTLNPSLTEDESFPRVSHLERLGVDQLVTYFDERFAPNYAGLPLRRGRHQGSVRVYAERTGRPRAVPTWARLDNILRAALHGHEVPAPLGDVAAIVDAVPYKFRRWGAVDKATKTELLAASLPGHLAFLATVRPSLVVLLGAETRTLLSAMPLLDDPERADGGGIREAGRRRLGTSDAEAEVLVCHHPISVAFAQAGTGTRLSARLRTHLLGGAVR